MRFFLVLIPFLCFAQPKPSEVLHILNASSTLDTDGNGTEDGQQCLNAWYALYGDTSHVLRISMHAMTNTSDHAQTIHIDYYSSFFDTSTARSSDNAVNLGVGEEYIGDEICEYFEADSANRWGKIKYPLFWIGAPIKIRGNDKQGAIPGDINHGGFDYSDVDSCLYKSIACMTALYVRPGCDASIASGLYDNLGRRFSNITLRATGLQTHSVAFRPGVDFVTSYLDSPQDTLTLWVLPCYLDGDTVTHVINALNRSVNSIFENSTPRNHVWGVIDQTDRISTDSYYTNFVQYRHQMLSLFDGKVLSDGDSISFAATDTHYVGWDGYVTLRSGDSCGVFFNSGDSHVPRPDSSEFWVRQLEFPIAAGALYWGSESYTHYSHRGALRPGGTQTQSLVQDVLRAGFSYSIGTTHEPYSTGLPEDRYLAFGLLTVDAPFAVVAWSSVYSIWQIDPVGNPIGILNKSTPSGWQNSWSEW